MVDRQRYKEIWKEEYQKVFNSNFEGEKAGGSPAKSQTPTTNN